MTITTTPIALCVDDFGQHSGIDEAVCSLLELKRITAVSCMSMAPRWASHSAPMLRERSEMGDYGLHFNLTENFGQSRNNSLSSLILRSYLHRLESDGLITLLQQQLDAFESAIGRTPDFIDGHQHVHQLPMVRDALLKVIKQRYPQRTPWIRNTRPANPQWGGKAIVLNYLGGSTLFRKLKKASIPSNNGFAGVYGFNTDNYAGCFEEWLKAASRGMLVMCHPATTLDKNDAISAQRLVEYQFFCSEQFPQMLAQHEVQLDRLSIISQKQNDLTQA
jgi:predicted glycoside hydrolase/deacetylase ChbG (UPF0249 family)